MAAFLDGDKLCEVAGKVKWSSLELFILDYHSGSLAIYKLFNSFYVHGITAAKRVKFLLKPDKFEVLSRESRLTLSITDTSKGSVSIYLQEATPNQLRQFLDSLNTVRAYHASLKGKLVSSENNKQNIENLPCNNSNTSNVLSPRVSKHESPFRGNSSSQNTQRPKPSFQSNRHAKQTNPPSSHNSHNKKTQNKKTPLVDRTFARDNLSNTSSGKTYSGNTYSSNTYSGNTYSSRKSASSFYGSRNSGWSPSHSDWKPKKTLGPGLMPPPRPGTQTSRLASQISFKSREKNPFEKEVELTGFSNLGNTCYMNAILQSLLGVPPFVQDLSNKALLDNVHPQCLYRCLHNVLSYKRKGGYPDVLSNCLRKLRRTISEAATRFSGYHQHDAHEFLCQVFDQLKDDVSNCISPSSKDASKDASKDTSKESNKMSIESQCPVTRSFESGVVHTIICKQCGESASKEEIYHAFSLDIPVLCNSSDISPLGAVSMQTLIEKHFEDEELEYTCSKCDSKEAVISHGFSRLPRVLILHLKRYGYDNLTEEQAKKEDIVKIERFIDITGMLSSSKSMAPFAFQPKPSSLKLSPAKSSRKPQKRHFISDDDDDDDSSDFQPSPSVRRKLVHSFTTATSTAKDSPPNTKTSSDDDVEIIGVSPKTVDCSKLDKKDQHNNSTVKTNDKISTKFDVDKKVNLERTSGSEERVWEGTEEEQIEWALTESAKSAEKESRAKLKEQEVTKNERERAEKSTAPIKKAISNFEDDDFILTSSEMSDEDLVNVAQESESDGVFGLKGGGPITTTTQNCSDDLDISGINYTSSNKSCSEDSGLEKSNGNAFVIRNTPIMCVKRANGSLVKKRKPLRDNVNLTSTPTLGKFDGNLFEDSVKENKVSANSVNLDDSSSTKSSWHYNAFRDEDMEKAINMSLHDQEKLTDEDEELKRALQLSLQEFEGKGSATDQAVSPTTVELENFTDPPSQDEEGELSTHSYRLISIVSHLGTRSTSGHYISDVYDCQTNKWTSYDDSTATQIQEHGVRYNRQHTGYIFFYLYKQCVDAIKNASPCKENSQR